VPQHHWPHLAPPGPIKLHSLPKGINTDQVVMFFALPHPPFCVAYLFIDPMDIYYWLRGLKVRCGLLRGIRCGYVSAFR
jgi:hypothetical protein